MIFFAIRNLYIYTIFCVGEAIEGLLKMELPKLVFFEKDKGCHATIWVFPKNRGGPPKMDGENNGKPYQNG